MSGQTSPFAPLLLTQYKCDQLEELARLVMGQVIEQFETHLTDPKRFVDPARWKLVKEREDVHVYKVRPPGESKSLDLQKGEPLTAGAV
jgi:hypothetical protein